MATPPINNNEDLLPPKVDFTAPPPYEENQSNLSVACKLPTYEEVQLEKSLHGELPMEYNHNNNNGSGMTNCSGLTTIYGDGSVGILPTTYLTGNTRQFATGLGPMSSPTVTTTTTATTSSSTSPQPPPPPPALTFIAIDATDTDNLNTVDKCVLGTDIMFITAFIAAFLFNWIGFLMLTCFCHTVACRYGALSGFGLSLAKWTLIVKHSTDLTSHENAWLWWLIMAFGFLISIRALLQYISIKRTWGLLSPDAQERLLFFY